MSRRGLLTGVLGFGAATTLAACTRTTTPAGGTPVGASAVAAAEAARTRTGATRRFALTAAPTQVDLGGTIVTTWAYNGSVPGTLLRATTGDVVTVAFANSLPTDTSVHWHGLAIRNDMDGVPGLTMDPVAAGGHFDYTFTVDNPGTHWFHPHTGLQLDRGLYAPFIVDDPTEPGDYDTEWVLILDDWTDGVGPSPEQILATLKAGGQRATSGMGDGMGGMGDGMGGTSGAGGPGGPGGAGAMAGMGGSDSGDVTYPLYLVNGRTTTDPDVLTATPGQRVRLRIINAAADTIFDVALAGHRLTVTHTDGYPVQQTSTDAVRLGMGERYDAVVTLTDGVFALVARPLGKAGLARALVRTGSGAVPDPTLVPAELTGTPQTATSLLAAPGTALPKQTPSTQQNVVLAGSMSSYTWTINGRTYDNTVPLTVRHDTLTRLRIRNMSMMTHPLHIHGHSFQLGPAGGTGPRKDTVLVPAMAAVDVDLLADNPGRWMVHCHNAYHAEAGMMTRLDYLR